MAVPHHEGGRIILSPAQLAAKAPAPRLTVAEQRVLARVKAKIERIRRDLLRDKGLTQFDDLPISAPVLA